MGILKVFTFKPSLFGSFNILCILYNFNPWMELKFCGTLEISEISRYKKNMKVVVCIVHVLSLTILL